MTAEEIRALRRRLKLSQHEMAVAVGTTATTIFRWEHGLRTPRNGLYARALRTLAQQTTEPAR